MMLCMCIDCKVNPLNLWGYRMETTILQKLELKKSRNSNVVLIRNLTRSISLRLKYKLNPLTFLEITHRNHHFAINQE